MNVLLIACSGRKQASHGRLVGDVIAVISNCTKTQDALWSCYGIASIQNQHLTDNLWHNAESHPESPLPSVF